MRLKIPLTGTVLEYDPVAAQLDGIGVVGDPKDPVRPVNLNLGGVSWRLIAIDLVNDLAEIEVSSPKFKDVLKDGGNPDNPDDWSRRQTTDTEKQIALNYARNLIETHTIDELYSLSKSKRLVKPAGSVTLYQQKPPKIGVRG